MQLNEQCFIDGGFKVVDVENGNLRVEVVFEKTIREFCGNLGIPFTNSARLYFEIGQSWPWLDVYNKQGKKVNSVNEFYNLQGKFSNEENNNLRYVSRLFFRIWTNCYIEQL
jgi:hypothetical protein